MTRATVTTTPMTLAPVWNAGRGPLRVLPRLLFRDGRPLLQILVAWLLTLSGSALIGVLVAWLGPEGAGPDMGDAPPLVQFGLIAVLSPVVETLMMGGALMLLLRWLRPWHAVVASAVGWGILHSLLAPMWGLVIWWPFLVFSTLFVTWRERGFWTACAIAAAVHGAQNVLPAAGLLLGY